MMGAIAHEKPELSKKENSWWILRKNELEIPKLDMSLKYFVMPVSKWMSLLKENVLSTKESMSETLHTHYEVWLPENQKENI